MERGTQLTAEGPGNARGDGRRTSSALCAGAAWALLVISQPASPNLRLLTQLQIRLPKASTDQEWWGRI